MGRSAVALAKALMRLAETHPDPNAGTLGEVFNRREFVEAPEDRRRDYMLQVAEARYRIEREVPYEGYFPGLDISPFFRDRRVLDFGCSTAGLARAILEDYAPSTLVGIEIDGHRLAAAAAHFRVRGLPVRWVNGDGQRLPFPDAAFDTVYSFDVFEHVPNLEAALKECARVLRPGGHVLAVFPSFYHWTEHHLSLVTLTPFVHYLFSRDTLSAAYHELLEARGPEAYWYRRDSPTFAEWERSYSINGVTRRRFARMTASAHLQIAHECRLVLGATGRLRQRHPGLARLVPFVSALARFPGLSEFLSHRIALVLRKPLAE